MPCVGSILDKKQIFTFSEYAKHMVTYFVKLFCKVIVEFSAYALSL